MAKKKTTAEKSIAEKNPLIVKGFKGFASNMQCRGKQYEIGKTYEEPSRKIVWLRHSLC